MVGNFLRLDAAAVADMQSSLENGMPIKLVYDAPSGGAQGYTLYDVAGNSIGSGSIGSPAPARAPRRR